jgi:hypothetical protein
MVRRDWPRIDREDRAPSMKINIVQNVYRAPLEKRITTTRVRVHGFMNKLRKSGFLQYEGGCGHTTLVSVVQNEQGMIDGRRRQRPGSIRLTCALLSSYRGRDPLHETGFRWFCHPLERPPCQR